MARTKSNTKRLPKGSSDKPQKNIKSKGSSTIKKRALAVMSAASKKWPRPPKVLANAIRSFEIPTTHAEFIMEDALTNLRIQFTYGPPENINAIDPDGGQYDICRVPVYKGGKSIGYVPLPSRYQGIWLDLCYSVVLFTTGWKHWDQETKRGTNKQKQMAKTCKQNCGAVLVAHMQARLLAVDQLVGLRYDIKPGEERVPILDEWKVRSLRDWLNEDFGEANKEGPHHLTADPLCSENEAFFKEGWDEDNEGLEVMTRPQGWTQGRLVNFETTFNNILKPQAYAELKNHSKFFETRYVEGAELPERWHEGHAPTPLYWSEKQFEWMVAGNDFWDQPFHFVHYALSTDQEEYEHMDEFVTDIRCLTNILCVRPDWDLAVQNAAGLWRGEMTWREFVESFKKIWLFEGRPIGPWQSTGTGISTVPLRHISTFGFILVPNNPFNTFEAELLLKGYLRRGYEDAEANWSDEDSIVWEGLGRISDIKGLRDGWTWVVNEVSMEGKTVKQALQDAGPMWVDYQARSAAAQSINNKGKHVMDVERSGGAATGGAFAEGAIRPPPVVPPIPAEDVAAHMAIEVDAIDGPADSGPPAPPAAAPIPIPMDDGGHSTASIRVPLPAPGGSHASASSSSVRLGMEHQAVHIGLAGYVSRGETLEMYSSSLRKAYAAPEYQPGIAEYLHDLGSIPRGEFKAIAFKARVESFIAHISTVGARLEAHKSSKSLL
ncbi:uncharacterized protein EDB91DRAFT_1256571 [Suillus paluster]|uniref:uncharacterized protein n=1 Tax=Suillus paluster TaxID=48578 RepID=UPI001B866043|nr:uncharacterized protein EDB91DRAFT_1256571 [Suillus paluster]KAG1721316.1 hypothetical protein EDB91DRAFT_1256571 [Suillus paluster]